MLFAWVLCKAWCMDLFMRKISDNNLLNRYISNHNIENIFDKDILKHAQLYFYEAGEFILQAGNRLEHYYLLVAGKVKVSYPFENGKSMFLKFYEGFNILGDIEFLKNIPVICNVETIKDAYLIAIPSAVLREKYSENTKFLHHLIDSISEKLYETINNSSYNFVYPLTNRLCSYLVEHITDKDYIFLKSSFEEIAQFLGTTYRHLNRTFKELESEAIIKCENKTIYILDEERLRELSKNLYMKPL